VAWRRVGLVLVAALAAAGLPVLAGWTAVRGAAPYEPARELPLLLALGAAPVVALLGAAAGAAWLKVGREVGARPFAAVLGALATFAGMLLGVYLHLVLRARAAGATGLPPIALLFRVDDFARAIPLLPVALLLGSLLGAVAAGRGAAAGVAAPVAMGTLLALGAGVATLLPVAIAAVIGGGATFGLFGALILVVAILAGRSRRIPTTR
jgi:hypothetical protein